MCWQARKPTKQTCLDKLESQPNKHVLTSSKAKQTNMSWQARKPTKQTCLDKLESQPNKHVLTSSKANQTNMSWQARKPTKQTSKWYARSVQILIHAFVRLIYTAAQYLMKHTQMDRRKDRQTDGETDRWRYRQTRHKSKQNKADEASCPIVQGLSCSQTPQGHGVLTCMPRTRCTPVCIHTCKRIRQSDRPKKTFGGNSQRLKRRNRLFLPLRDRWMRRQVRESPWRGR